MSFPCSWSFGDCSCMLRNMGLSESVSWEFWSSPTIRRDFRSWHCFDWMAHGGNSQASGLFLVLKTFWRYFQHFSTDWKLVVISHFWNRLKLSDPAFSLAGFNCSIIGWSGCENVWLATQVERLHLWALTSQKFAPLMSWAGSCLLSSSQPLWVAGLLLHDWIFYFGHIFRVAFLAKCKLVMCVWFSWSGLAYM